jgi:DNA-directed RNA polymerase subunit H (RpoH/RPB5)
MEDVGYETAKIKGGDVLGTMVTMLRQRGMMIFEVYGVSTEIPPLETVHATAEDERSSAQSILSCFSRSSLLPSSQPPPIILKARFVEGAAASSSAACHVASGKFGIGDELWAFMVLTGTAGIKQIRVIRQAYEHSKPSVLMLVTREKVTAQAAETIRKDGIHLEKFLLQELSYNITRHFLVPAHRICSPEEVSALRKKYNNKLALQSRDDPISRFHGLFPGDVVEYRRVRLAFLGGVYYREVF